MILEGRPMNPAQGSKKLADVAIKTEIRSKARQKFYRRWSGQGNRSRTWSTEYQDIVSLQLKLTATKPGGRRSIQQGQGMCSTKGGSTRSRPGRQENQR